MTRTARLAGTLAVLTLLGALTGCGSSLQSTDPDGYAACVMLSESRASTEIAETLDKTLLSGEYAFDATTPAIRATATAMLDDAMLEELTDSTGQTQRNFYVADADALLKACTDAGMRIADIENDKS